MSACCYPDEYGDLFGQKNAAREARRYRKRGLGGSEKVLADVLRERAEANSTILEAGGGVGALQVELLRSGAGSSTNIELSPEWEGAARGLLAHYDLADRVERRLGDFVDEADALPAADVVVLHRVVCCYPHWRRMLEAAVGRTRHTLALTFPLEGILGRALLTLGNWAFRLRRRSFRAFIHPHREMLALVADHGFRIVHDARGLVWRSVVLERAA